MKTKALAADTPAQELGRHEELRQILEQRRNSITSAIRDHVSAVRTQHGETNTAGVLDDVEAADADLQEDIELALIEARLETLQKIDASLRRLEAGLYGLCSECGEEISAVRLRALPFAVRCRDCEEDHESTVKREREKRQRPFALFAEPAGRDR
jgi:DnaK suppressor protein